jgi:hypothetical protein
VDESEAIFLLCRMGDTDIRRFYGKEKGDSMLVKSNWIELGRVHKSSNLSGTFQFNSLTGLECL